MADNTERPYNVWMLAPVSHGRDFTPGRVERFVQDWQEKGYKVAIQLDSMDGGIYDYNTGDLAIVWPRYDGYWYAINRLYRRGS